MSVVAQFELLPSRGVIPKRPRFYQRAEGSPIAHCFVAGDTSLRLKNGCARDDAIDEAKDSFRTPFSTLLTSRQLSSRILQGE